MASQEGERLHRTFENEGDAEITNSKTRTDLNPAVSPENGRNTSAHSLSLGEKRKAPSSLQDGEGQKRSKPFTMKVPSRTNGGDATAATMQGRDKTSKPGGITMRLGAAKPIKTVSLKLTQKPKEPEIKAPTSKAVAKAFADESDEEEEMPPEAKMRMKNVGRETPTSAGPNSFNKSKHGFDDHARAWKKDIDTKISTLDPEKK